MTATEIVNTRVTPDVKGGVATITQAEMLTEAVWLGRHVSRGIQEPPACVSHRMPGSSAPPGTVLHEQQQHGARLYTERELIAGQLQQRVSPINFQCAECQLELGALAR
jgi:hypothetical protein